VALNRKLGDAGRYAEVEDGAKGREIIPSRTSLGQDNRINGLFKIGKHFFCHSEPFAVILSIAKNLVLHARDKRREESR
jgi:hypothetical protein